MALVGAAVAFLAWPGTGSTHVSVSPADVATPRGPSAPTHPDTLESLVSAVTPAVVLIKAETPAGPRQGSGFLVDPSGLILTNYHVIRDASSAEIKLSSGDVYRRVTVLAVDDRRDIAVLSVPGFDLPSLRLGNSDSTRIGMPVVAIGSPMGLENTVSTGIVSGRRQEPEGYQLMQITAPASTGSSGGPVLSRQEGDVVGIAASQMENGQNLNFAVPINYARGLLSSVGGEPVSVLTPAPARSSRAAADLASGSNVVNRGLRVDLAGFGGYTAEMEGPQGYERSRKTRVTYRRIEEVGGGEPRIERYAESETTAPSGPFGTRQTVRRTRSRTLADAENLNPVSARGETAWWTEDGWRAVQYDLRFEDGRVRGTVQDSTGRSAQVDRELPRRIILREMRHLAFALLTADTLVGRSVELVTFDAERAEITRDRYDVRADTSVRVGNEEYDALRVEMATGLSNETAYFRARRPRVLLRVEGPGGAGGEELTNLRFFTGRGDHEDDGGP